MYGLRVECIINLLSDDISESVIAQLTFLQATTLDSSTLLSSENLKNAVPCYKLLEKMLKVKLPEMLLRDSVHRS